MTQPDPGQRLQAAVAALCDPTTVRVDRLATTEHDRDAVRATNADAAANHREQLARYRRRLDAYDDRDDQAGVRRVQALIDHRETIHKAAIEQRRVSEAVVPSLLDRLLDAVHGSGGSNGASGAGAHRSPIGLAAAELLADIRRTIGCRELDRHRDLCLRDWAADLDGQDPDIVEQWVATGRAIIEPPRTAEARAACPACGTRHVTVIEAGEPVRRAAISINLSAGYAQCLNRACGTTWDRDHFPLLAAALYQDVDERTARRAR